MNFVPDFNYNFQPIMPHMLNAVSKTTETPYPMQKRHEGTKEKGSKAPKSCSLDIPMDISKPLIYSMGIFGLLFINSRKWKWALLTKVYSSIVLLLVWAKFFRAFFQYGGEVEFGPALFLKLVHHFWYLMCAIGATVTYKACMSQQKIKKFLMSWSQLVKTNRGCNPDDSEQKCHLDYIKQMKIRCHSCLAIGWFVFLVNATFNGYLIFFTNIVDFNIYPVTRDSEYDFMFRCIFAITDIYNSAAWIFTHCLFFLMAGVIYKEFEIMCQDFRKGISPDGDMPCLEYFRVRHQEICQLVETADDILSAFNSSAIVCQACDGMLILYSLVWYQSFLSDTLILVCHVFWLWACLAFLLTIAFGGAYLNHMAHSPLKIIHSIRVTEVSSKLALQMNMFLTKLTGESIGLTALDMFVIDKPTILTIAGAFLTYFIVLVQFQQPADKEPSVLDCEKYFLNTTLLS